MRDYFAELVLASGATADGDPVTDVERYYRAAGRQDTLAHVTAVAAEARALAQRHGADVDAAYLAAMAHDLAAVVPVVEMTAVAEHLGLEVSAADRAMPGLLHGPIAAAALAAKLSLGDTDVLDAVRYHSTLRAGAGLLEKIVFLADKIAYDPRSPHAGEYLPTLRAAGTVDGAVLVYLDFLLDNAWRYGWLLHPRVVATYRDLSGRVAR